MADINVNPLITSLRPRPSPPHPNILATAHAFWRVLMAMTVAAAVRPTPSEYKQTHIAISRWLLSYPCVDICVKHALETIYTHHPFQYTTRYELIAWGVALHNHVRRKTHKPEKRIEEALADFFAPDPTPEDVYTRAETSALPQLQRYLTADGLIAETHPTKPAWLPYTLKIIGGISAGLLVVVTLVLSRKRSKLPYVLF